MTNFLMILKKQWTVLTGNAGKHLYESAQNSIVLALKILDSVPKPAVRSITDPSDLISLKSRSI